MPGNIVNLTPSTIASWPTPNYIDPAERTWMPLYAGVLYGVSTIMIALRLWLRVLKQAGGLGLDDALLGFAWFGSSMFTAVLVISAYPYDVGRHAWDVPLQNFETIALLAWLAQFSSLVTGAATKISVLCFYRRLVAGTYSRRWKWAVLFAIFFTLAWTLTFVFMLIFNCNPTRAYWKSFDPLWQHNYTCINTTVVNLLAGIFAALSDMYAVALPCLMTRHFDLPRRQKVALNMIFCLGLLVVGASGVRTYYLWQVGKDSDVSWMIFDAYVWAQLELQLSIICASLPALRVFLRKYFSAPFSRGGLSRTQNSAMSYQRGQKQGQDMHMRAISNPVMIDTAQNDFDFDIKRKSQVPSTVEEVPASDGGFGGWEEAPTTPSEARLWKSPHTSESYNNMDVIDSYARSVRSPSFERSKSARSRSNFSQPFQAFHDERG